MSGMMGKNVYHLFHVEMGTQDAPPFERLPNREQEAWGAVARHVADQYEYIQKLNKQIWIAERELRELREFKQKTEARRPGRKKAPV